MKCLTSVLLFFAGFFCNAQTDTKIRNVIIVTTDGFRWQEIFTGADSQLINSVHFNADTSLVKAQYWNVQVEERRKKLMPFFWNVLAKRGQVYGNRDYKNKVNLKNIFKISYPGYNEILTGYADPNFIPNTKVNNPNPNILDWLNKQDAYKGKVVAFASWNVFPFILNRERTGLPINSGYEDMEEDADSSYEWTNTVQNNVQKKGHTRYDELTFLNAMEYIKINKPRITFIGLGETDEFAHAKRYDLYLKQAGNVDRMLESLWYYIQTDPFYKNNTTLIVTTDHGRGKTFWNWNKHSVLTAGSGQAWLAIIGPDILPLGELTIPNQFYHNQIAATVAAVLGLQFNSIKKIGKPLELPRTKELLLKDIFEATAGKN